MKKRLLRNLSLLLVFSLLATFTQFTPVQAASSMKIVGAPKRWCIPGNDAKGTTAQLRVQGANGKKVTWKSSNPKVVKVTKNGVVSILRDGESLITAKVGNKTLKLYVEAYGYHDFATRTCTYCNTKAAPWWETRADVQKQLEDLVFSLVTPDMNDEEKVAAIVDWMEEQPEVIRENFEFKYDEHHQRIPKYCNACDGLAAWNGLGDCQQMAQVFFIMAYAAGLEVQLIASNGHEWNTVKVDGLWYVCDTTVTCSTDRLYTDPLCIDSSILQPIDCGFDNKTYSDVGEELQEEKIILYNANYLTDEQYYNWSYGDDIPYLTNN